MTSIAEVRGIIKYILSDNYDDYFRTLTVLKKEFIGIREAAGKQLARKWAINDASYDTVEFDTKWEAVDTTADIGMGWLVDRAEKNGYIPISRSKSAELEEKERKDCNICDENIDSEVINRDKEERRKQKERKQKNAAKRAKRMWDKADQSLDIVSKHPYIIDKGINPHGTRILGDNLLVSIEVDGELTSIQTIDEKGIKRFIADGLTKGGYYIIGEPTDTILIGEGFATMATAYEAIGFQCIVTFSCGNLKPVAKAVRIQYSDKQIIILGDNDQHKDTNTGVIKATEAAKAIGGCLAIPRFTNTHLSTLATDFNDLYFYEKIEAVKQQIMAVVDADQSIVELSPFERLKSMSATHKLDEMQEHLDNDVYVFDDMALMGQSTLFYAKPNTGKTLLFLNLLINAISHNRIKAEDVIYINADDSYKGLYQKAKIAEEYGFYMVSPAMESVNTSDIVAMLDEISQSNEAMGKIIIIDTLKKFVNVMDKPAQSLWYDVIGRLTAKNATVIIAGHTNKRTEKDGTLIPEGTSDSIDNIHCSYAIYMREQSGGRNVIEFVRGKNRGDVVEKASYAYRKVKGMSYRQILDSVQKLDDRQVSEVEDYVLKERYKAQISFVEELLADVTLNQTEILEAFDDNPSTDFSKASLRKALRMLDGITWGVTTDRMDNNAKIYSLLESTTVQPELEEVYTD